MKKMGLSLDALVVDSFVTSPVMQRRGGTVKAHSIETTYPEGQKITGAGSCDDYTQCAIGCQGGTCVTGSQFWYPPQSTTCTFDKCD